MLSDYDETQLDYSRSEMIVICWLVGGANVAMLAVGHQTVGADLSTRLEQF